MNALARLIQQRKDELSLTFKQIAERSRPNKKSAITVSTGLLSKWMSARKLTDIPRATSLKGLALALQLPAIRVLLAAGEAAGLDLTDPARSQFAGKLPTSIDQLQIADQELALRVAWRLTATNDDDKQSHR